MNSSVEETEVTTHQDIAELQRLGGIRTDGTSYQEWPGTEQIQIEAKPEYLGSACYNNSTWCLVTKDGQVWSFFRTENPEIVDARRSIFRRLADQQWNWVPFSNGGQTELIRRIVEANEADPMVIAELKTYLAER